MREAQCGERMDREGEIHDGFSIAHDGRLDRVDLHRYSGGKTVIVYGQTEMTRDLYDARDRMTAPCRSTMPRTCSLHDIATDAPSVTYRDGDDTVARSTANTSSAADGFHGVSRKAIPEDVLREHERVYPFGWLGVLVDDAAGLAGIDLCQPRARLRAVLDALARPAAAITSRCRSRTRSRTGQTSGSGTELSGACDRRWRSVCITGPSIEKSIAPLRSFVAEPMRYGRLFLAGDAAHIVPPTGAQAASTSRPATSIYLSSGAGRSLSTGRRCRARRLFRARRWRGSGRRERFSWWMTMLLHRFPDQFELREPAAGDRTANICSRRKWRWARSPRTMSACRLGMRGMG